MSGGMLALIGELEAVLVRIAAYDPPTRMHKASERDWGLPAEEAIEMAYENVIGEAKAALKRTARARRKIAARAGAAP